MTVGGGKITHDKLLALLSYEEDTGIFRWKIARSNKVNVGDRAGCLNKVHGYWRISLDGKSYRGSRLAFFYKTGKWPSEVMDHIDGNPANDRWANLRSATRTQNQANRKLNKNNKSGFKGVHFFKPRGKWCAQITIDKRGVNLGYYNSPQAAHAAYLAKAKEVFGIFHMRWDANMSNKPEWGTPEHSAWLDEIGRRAFCAGEPLNINAIDPIDPVHLKLSALDIDKLNDKENNYEVFPRQSGSD